MLAGIATYTVMPDVSGEEAKQAEAGVSARRNRN